MSYRRMGIDEIRDIEHGTIVDTTEIDGDIKCFYCQEIIEQDGVAGKGSWMFHNECYYKHADSINGYFEQEEKKFRCVYGCGTEMEYDEYADYGGRCKDCRKNDKYVD